MAACSALFTSNRALRRCGIYFQRRGTIARQMTCRRQNDTQMRKRKLCISSQPRRGYRLRFECCEKRLLLAATDVNWTGNSSSEFQDGANWDTMQQPTIDNNVHFAKTTASVVLSDAPLNPIAALYNDAGKTNLDLAGNDLNVNDTISVQGGSLTIKNNWPPGSSDKGGHLSAQNNTAITKVNVGAAGKLFVGPDVKVNTDFLLDDGFAAFADKSDLFVDTLSVGANPNTNATLKKTNLSITHDLYVGGRGSGSVNTSGGLVGGNVYVGRTSSGSGTLNLNLTSKFTVGGSPTIGDSGNGSLIIGSKDTRRNNLVKLALVVFESYIISTACETLPWRRRFEVSSRRSIR